MFQNFKSISFKRLLEVLKHCKVSQNIREHINNILLKTKGKTKSNIK